MNISVRVSEAWYERASSYMADWEDPSLLLEDQGTEERVERYLKEEAHDLVYAVLQAYMSKRERG